MGEAGAGKRNRRAGLGTLTAIAGSFLFDVVAHVAVVGLAHLPAALGSRPELAESALPHGCSQVVVAVGD